MKYYAGVGPRKMDTDTLAICTDIAKQLWPTGWWLRSGHAIGTDRAFARGAVNQHNFLPWNGYNSGYTNNIDKAVVEITAQQVAIAKEHYEAVNGVLTYNGFKPRWEDLTHKTVLLMCRNVPIVLGEFLDDPVKMLITAVPKDYHGGTAHTISIARAYDVPVFNILDSKDQVDLCKFVLEGD